MAQALNTYENKHLKPQRKGEMKIKTTQAETDDNTELDDSTVIRGGSIVIQAR
jgi:hypothetical protein